MKVNEAPEKLYVNFHFMETHPESYQPLVTKQGINKYDIEYTRTDAFIEKATKWLKEWNAYRVCLEGRKDWFIEQFRKAMKEE